MITVSRKEELDVLIHTIEGIPVYTEISNAIDSYYKGVLTKYTIWDFSKTDPSTHLTSEETKKLGRQVNLYAGRRPGGVDILVVPGILQYGLARIYQAYSAVMGKDDGKLKAKIFRKYEDGLQFIRRNEINTKSVESALQK